MELKKKLGTIVGMGDFQAIKAQCAQDPGGVRPGAVRPTPGAVWDKMVVVHAKARNNRKFNAASIQMPLKRQYQISRESAIDKNGAISRESIIDKNGAVSQSLKRQYRIIRESFRWQERSRCNDVACKATKLGCEILRDICSYHLLNVPAGERKVAETIRKSRKRLVDASGEVTTDWVQIQREWTKTEQLCIVRSAGKALRKL
ncbi:hypothetical protein L2E82_45529 [Cichorium intybus]|uniref:Uncharacterized protein n=1 Tax=Cichorium intybus TaxID=13427 RepID=A0ACB8ZTC0_CICIN|nr:hypothetical protein L2E82_45529 [Cichorium intybus]